MDMKKTAARAITPPRGSVGEPAPTVPDLFAGAVGFSEGFTRAGFRSKKTQLGYRANEDQRNFPFEFMVEAALELKPRPFLMENVPVMQSVKHEDVSFWSKSPKWLQNAGYPTESGVSTPLRYAKPENADVLIISAAYVFLPACDIRSSLASLLIGT